MAVPHVDRDIGNVNLEISPCEMKVIFLLCSRAMEKGMIEGLGEDICLTPRMLASSSLLVLRELGSVTSALFLIS